MHPLLTDAQFNSACLVVIALITTVGGIFTARWAHSAKKNAVEAKATSVEAKEAADTAAYEVSPNGGMDSPVPNLNDHVQYQTIMLEKLMSLPERMTVLEKTLSDHIEVANFMAPGFAELYLKVMGEEPPGADEQDNT